MPCPHFTMSIVSRKDNDSAVDKSAYQSRERLYSERNHRTEDYEYKKDCVLKEIMLPPNAPREFSDRETLWNSVEAAEPNWNSQLCRRFMITLPRELSMEGNISLIREYCENEFLAKGMVVDLCVHDPDPPNHNPHAHVLTTMRPIDEHGHWMPKSRKEYVLDESGNRIRNSNGKWKTYKVFTTDWDKRGNVEMWRDHWEKLQNNYLEQAGRPERVCLKSYERQGIDRIPTVHMGPAVAAMERVSMKTILKILRWIPSPWSCLRTSATSWQSMLIRREYRTALMNGSTSSGLFLSTRFYLRLSNSGGLTFRLRLRVKKTSTD